MTSGPTVDDFTKPPKKKTAPKPVKKPPTQRQIQESLDSAWIGLSVYVGTVRNDEYCAGIVAERGPVLTEQLLELAKVNPYVKRALEAFATTGAWGGVFSATMALVLPIAAHHDRLPPGLATRLANVAAGSGADNGDRDTAPTTDGNPDSGLGGPYEPVGMETGRTRNVSRADGMRQDDTGRTDSGAA